MFLLTDDELRAGPILDCPAGALPFGALVQALGGQAVSVDPAYGEPDGLVDRVAVDIDRIADWHRANPAGFNWSYRAPPGSCPGPGRQHGGSPPPPPRGPPPAPPPPHRHACRSPTTISRWRSRASCSSSTPELFGEDELL